MFLTLDDYRSVCDDYEFKQITRNDDIRLTEEAAAMEQIASYLRHRYDLDRAFAAAGTCRNSMLVQCAVNIALWLMIHRLPQNTNAGNVSIMTLSSGCATFRQAKPPRTCLFMRVRTGTTRATLCGTVQ